MGIRCWGSSSGCSYEAVAPEVAMLPNPDPKNWTLISRAAYQGRGGIFTVLCVRYPDCTNYEGEKVIVVEGFGPGNDEPFDPHFCDGRDGHAPTVKARFRPDETGKREADAYARALAGMK